MGSAKHNLAVAETGNPLPPLNPQQKESLLMLIVLNYAEAHGLLSDEQLADARASLRALFLRATGEETMLRKLIDQLQVNRTLNRSFSEIGGILDGIHKSHHALAGRHQALRQQLALLQITPEENRQFIGPLLEFSGEFVEAVTAFDSQMMEYLGYKENEARSAHVFRLAQEARERLKRRFESGDSEDGHAEQHVKQKVFQSFNYAEAESDYHYQRRSAGHARREIEQSLQSFQQRCQMAMRPEMRSRGRIGAASPDTVDVYAVCLKGMELFPRLHVLLPAVQELLRLVQGAYGMFHLDFEKFNKALGPLTDSTHEYFQAREQDDDMRTKQQKLDLIEKLIAFIEDVSSLLRDGQVYAYPRFSQAVSARISAPGAAWSGIAEELLHRKVAAEADLTTRLG